MDETLLKTFLAVASTESFVAAAERMHVTQSTISQRINKLEQHIGHRLFERSKRGVELTLHGAKFENYARSIKQLYDEAIFQTGLPERFDDSLSLGCEESLWPELATNWLAQLAEKLPTTTISFVTGSANQLTHQLRRGQVNIALLHSPIIRPGFKLEHVLDDSLVLVTATTDHNGILSSDYIYIPWGDEFAINHSRWYPDMAATQLTLQVGPSAANYLIQNKKTAFLPYRIADDFVAAGQLHFVENSPQMPFPCFAVWTEETDEERLEKAMVELRFAAKNAPLISF